MHSKISPIILNSEQKADMLSEIFIAQPNTNQEKIAGKLFILLEITAQNKNTSRQLARFIISELDENYYNEKIKLKKNNHNLSIEHFFETALARTNKNLGKFIEDLRKKKGEIIDFENMNITAGVIYENTIYFSNNGKNKILLIYKEEHNLGQYKICDINEDEISEPGKLFSNVVNGDIPDAGYLFLTNEALSEYLSKRQIIDIITKSSIQESESQIKEILNKISIQIPFLGIIIKNQTKNNKEIPTEEKEEEEINNYYQEKIQKTTTNQNEENKINIAENYNEEEIKEEEEINEKYCNSSISNLNETKDKTEKLVKTKLINFRFLSRILRRKNKENTIKLKSDNQLKKRISVVLFVIGITCIAFLFINASLTKQKNIEEVQKNQNDQLITDIEDKQNQIFSQLLYKNEEGAKEILRELKALLDKFPQDTEEEINLLKAYRQKYEKDLAEIQHMIKIDNPRKLADFSDFNENAKTKNIIKVANKIYAADIDQKTIYNLNLENNLLAANSDTELDLNAFSYPVLSNKNIYYFNNDSLVKLDTVNKSLSRLDLGIEGEVEIRDIEIYNNRLYALDNKNSQIYKYEASRNGYPTYQNWIASDVELGDLASMAVDGNIFVLKSDGQIIKYLKGKEQEFIMDMIDPEFRKTDKLMISQIAEYDYLYILESIRKRVAVFRKNGEFTMQYQCETCAGLDDFIIDEAAEKLYLLDGNIVYETDAVHLDEEEGDEE